MAQAHRRKLSTVSSRRSGMSHSRQTSINAQTGHMMQQQRSLPDVSEKILIASPFYKVRLIDNTIGDSTTHAQNISGQIDLKSGKVMLVSQYCVNIYDCNRLHGAAPTCISFPQIEENDVPAVCLVSPRARSVEPGLVIVRKRSGIVNFWDSIGRALSITSQHGADGHVPLSSSETVISLHNAEPAGILIATSSGSCYVMQVRDHSGKPKITVSHLSTLPFISNIVDRITSIFRQSYLKNEICAIISSETDVITDKDVITVSSSGLMSRWILSRANSNRLITEQNCSVELSSKLDAAKLPYSPFMPSLQIHGADQFQQNGKRYLILFGSFSSNKSQHCLLIIYEIKGFDLSSFVFESFYIMQSYHPPIEHWKDMSCLVQVTNTSIVTVTLNDAILMAYIPKDLKDNWVFEDVLTLCSDLELTNSQTAKYGPLIASGLIQNSDSEDQSLFAMLLQNRLLKCDFTIPKTYSTDPLVKVIDKLEQVAMYSNLPNSPLRFSFSSFESLSSYVISSATIDVSNRILKMKYPFEPSSSVPQDEYLLHLSHCHANIFQFLIRHLLGSQLGSTDEGKLKGDREALVILMQNTEKQQIAFHVWKDVFSNPDNSPSLLSKFLPKPATRDIEKTYREMVPDILVLLANASQQSMDVLSEGRSSSENSLNIIIISSQIFIAALNSIENFREKLIFDLQSTESVYQYSLCSNEEVLGYISRHLGVLRSLIESSRNEPHVLLKLGHIHSELTRLYVYFVQTLASSNSDKKEELQSIVQENLLTIAATGNRSQALYLAELYEDFQTHVRLTLETSNSSFTDLSRSIERFGEVYAFKVYETLITQDQLDLLWRFAQCSNVEIHQHMERFLETHHYPEIAWMFYVQNNKKRKAHENLYELSQNADSSLKKVFVYLSLAKLCDQTTNDDEINAKLKKMEVQTNLYKFLLDCQKDGLKIFRDGLGEVTSAILKKKITSMSKQKLLSDFDLFMILIHLDVPTGYTNDAFEPMLEAMILLHHMKHPYRAVFDQHSMTDNDTTSVRFCEALFWVQMYKSISSLQLGENDINTFRQTELYKTVKKAYTKKCIPLSMLIILTPLDTLKLFTDLGLCDEESINEGFQSLIRQLFPELSKSKQIQVIKEISKDVNLLNLEKLNESAINLLNIGFQS